MKIVKVYVLRDKVTGLYYRDAGTWVGDTLHRKWVGRCTLSDRSEATEFTEEEIAYDFPEGLPDGWEKVLVMEFEARQ